MPDRAVTACHDGLSRAIADPADLGITSWQLVIAHGGTPDRTTAFPIYDSRVGPRGGPRSTAISGGVDPAAQAIIEHMQPYNQQGIPTDVPLASE